MNLDKVFNFIKEKKGYEIPLKYRLIKIIKKLTNNIPLSDDEINSADGHFNLNNTNITSLGNLTTVGGNLDLSYTPIKSLGNLKTVDGSLSLIKTPIESLGNLTTVGGNLDLTFTPIESLGNLKTVGGYLFLAKTPISKKYTEQEIRQMVNVKGSIIYTFAEYERVTLKYTSYQKVINFQTALKLLGYKLGNFGLNKDGVDGKFGPITQTALKDFQSKNKLDSSLGKMDRATAKKLSEVLKTNKTKGSEQVQRNLNSPFFWF